MIFFWVQLPDKFRWGACRYVFFFIGASAFLNIWLRWRDVLTTIRPQKAAIASLAGKLTTANGCSVKATLILRVPMRN